jgi:[acyl-carrier-protein] S-malonyltransferase
VSGTIDGIAYLEENVNSLGWKRCRRLAVGGAFHSPLMQPAATDFAEALTRVTFHSSPYRVFSNVDGSTHSIDVEWRDLALRQLTEPVQFVECVTNASKFVDRAVEFEPTGVLRGLIKRIAPGLATAEFSRRIE